MNILISGGCKNGKSIKAQEIARDMARDMDVPLYYVATMLPVDEEDYQRIANHKLEREGWGFLTIEQPRSICDCLTAERNLNGVFLVDSVTAILANEMFPEPAIKDGEQIWTMDKGAGTRLARDLLNFAKLTGNTVFVSDYIYGEVKKYDQTTETYKRWLGEIDRALAKVCHKVLEVNYGICSEWEQVQSLD